MSEQRKSNLELAQDFYKHHEFAFRQAAIATDVAERQFAFSDAQFDDWAVARGHLPVTARDADESQHGTVVIARNKLRIRLNRAAHRGESLPRAFSVVARNRVWRVVLLEKFLVEQPTTIVRGIQQCLERSERSVDQVKRFVSAQDEARLPDEQRMLITVRLEMAQLFVFNGLQMLETIIAGFTAEQAPNLRRLRRKMAEVLLRETQGASAKRAKPKRSRRA